MDEVWYAVQKGHKPGVYATWNECKLATYGFRGAKFRKFNKREEAEDFSKGIDRKAEEEITVWKKTETETFQDMINNLGNSSSNSSIKEEQIKKREGEENVIRKSLVNVMERIDVWVYGCPDGIGSLAVYFGPEDPRNTATQYEWAKPISKTRTGIAACIRALSIVIRSRRETLKKEYIGLTFRSESKYLCRALMKWITCWSKTKSNIVADDRDKDLFKFMYKQVINTKIKLSVAQESNSDCENLLAAKSMAESVFSKKPSLKPNTKSD